jgi:hypothetical protein
MFSMVSAQAPIPATLVSAKRVYLVNEAGDLKRFDSFGASGTLILGPIVRGGGSRASWRARRAEPLALDASPTKTEQGEGFWLAKRSSSSSVSHLR